MIVKKIITLIHTKLANLIFKADTKTQRTDRIGSKIILMFKITTVIIYLMIRKGIKHHLNYKIIQILINLKIIQGKLLEKNKDYL